MTKSCWKALEWVLYILILVCLVAGLTSVHNRVASNNCQSAEVR